MNSELLTTEEGAEEPSVMELGGETDAQVLDFEDTEGDADLTSKESNLEMEFDEDEDEEEANTSDYKSPEFPISRVKKIMSICTNTTEEEDEADKDDAGNVKDKTKGKGGSMIIMKEAAYLMSLAAEHFVGTVGEMAGRITVSSKKKTMNLEHLKRALSDTDSFAFLEGCFQPSIIIGD